MTSLGHKSQITIIIRHQHRFKKSQHSAAAAIQQQQQEQEENITSFQEVVQPTYVSTSYHSSTPNNMQQDIVQWQRMMAWEMMAKYAKCSNVFYYNGDDKQPYNCIIVLDPSSTFNNIQHLTHNTTTYQHYNT